jgi:hypothetical protein
MHLSAEYFSQKLMRLKNIMMTIVKTYSFYTFMLICKINIIFEYEIYLIVYLHFLLNYFKIKSTK